MGVPRQDEAALATGAWGLTISEGKDYGATDVDGESIDRVPGAGQQYLSAQLDIRTANGAAGDSVQFALYESSDDSTWTEVTDVTIPALTTASDSDSVNIDLSSRDRYIRLELVGADQTVGTSIDVDAHFTLMGAKDKPAS